MKHRRNTPRMSAELKASLMQKRLGPTKPTNQYGLYCDNWMQLVYVRAANKLLAKHGFFKHVTVAWEDLCLDPDSIAAGHLRPIFVGSVAEYVEA